MAFAVTGVKNRSVFIWETDVSYSEGMRPSRISRLKTRVRRGEWGARQSRVRAYKQHELRLEMHSAVFRNLCLDDSNRNVTHCTDTRADKVLLQSLQGFAVPHSLGKLMA